VETVYSTTIGVAIGARTIVFKMIDGTIEGEVEEGEVGRGGWRGDGSLRR